MIVSDGVCFVRLRNRLCYVLIKSSGSPVVKYMTVIYACHTSRVGDVIIQARATTGKDEAFRVSAALPQWKWIRLDCYIQDSKV